MFMAETLNSISDLTNVIDLKRAGRLVIYQV